jgi:hypothetical protein
MAASGCIARFRRGHAPLGARERSERLFKLGFQFCLMAIQPVFRNSFASLELVEPDLGPNRFAPFK